MPLARGNSSAAYPTDGWGNLIRETTGGVTSDLVLDEGGPLTRILAEVRSDGTELLYAHGAEGFAAQTSVISATLQPVVYPLLDALGSVRHLTDSDGVLVRGISYEAFGRVRHSTGSAFTTLGFTGERMGAVDGTVYLCARHYQPALGRFLQRDSFPGVIDRPQSLNRYAYAGNNPARYTDPAGHCGQCLVAILEILNPENASPAGGDLYDENGNPCGDTGCVGPAKTVGDILPRVALDAAGAKVGGWAAGAAWSAMKGPAGKVLGGVGGVVGNGLRSLGGTIEGVLGRSAEACWRPIAGGAGQAARAAARFIARSDGEILDVTRIVIPGPRNSPYGKIDYLLGRVPDNLRSIGRGGFFAGEKGFDPETLAGALRTHLIEHFESAIIQGSKITVDGAVDSPSGVATIRSVWQVTADGFVQLVTAVPK